MSHIQVSKSVFVEENKKNYREIVKNKIKSTKVNNNKRMLSGFSRQYWQRHNTFFDASNKSGKVSLYKLHIN